MVEWSEGSATGLTAKEKSEPLTAKEDNLNVKLF